MNKPKEKKFLEKFKHKYRFVVLQEDSLEERTSFRLSRFNIFMIICSFSLILTILISLLISFTRIREYIPGYADFRTREIITEQILRADSLEMELLKRDDYINNIKMILSGEVTDFSRDSYKKTDSVSSSKNLDLYQKSHEDSILREEFESQDLSNVFYEEGAIHDNVLNNIVFYPPVEGLVTQKFNLQSNHPAVDIASAPKKGIKSVLDGTVIYSDWNVKTGFSIVIQHQNNLLSVYKHNSVLLKKIGNFVRAGEVIAIIGETGELSNGPHLHFELWYDGKAINPEDFMVF